MNIGEAAKASGISAKMIRYYESIELIPKSLRTEAGYRSYTQNDLYTLRFIKRSRKLGFSLETIKDLLSLWRDSDRASADVKAIAQVHIVELEKQISELTEMRDTLNHLVETCAGNNRPDCPILRSLATECLDKECY